MRKLAYKFRVSMTPRQRQEMERYCSVARYVWNWALAMYEAQLDASRAADAGDGNTVRDRLEALMYERGYSVSRRGVGKTDGRKLSLVSIMNALWRHHRDKEAPPWVCKGVHSHVGGYAVQRLCETTSRWWKAKGKRTPWFTASERKAGKRKARGPGPRGSEGRLVGPPRYKRNGQNPAFTIQARKATKQQSSRDLAIKHRGVYVPGGRGCDKPIGWLRVEGANESPMRRLHSDAVPKSITVRKVAGHWEVTVTVEEPAAPQLPVSNLRCGIDLGINAVATIAWSDGRFERIEPPRPMARLGVRLVLLQQRLSASRHVLRCRECGNETPLGERDKRIRKCHRVIDEKECGGRVRRWRSKRGLRLKLRLAKLHYRIEQIRNAHLHLLSHRLTREASVICTEPHNITGLVSAGVARSLEGKWRSAIRRKDRRRAMLDIAWGEFRRQLNYKAGWYGREYVTLEEGTATDKTCHRCGHQNEMPDNTSAYACVDCGWEGTRQENTALLCLGYVSGNVPTPSRPPSPRVSGGNPGRPGGDPVTGRRDGTVADLREQGLNDRGSDVNDHTSEITRGAVAPRGTRKGGKTRKMGSQSRQPLRAEMKVKKCT